jgi:chromosome segregation ATPase
MEEQAACVELFQEAQRFLEQCGVGDSSTEPTVLKTREGCRGYGYSKGGVAGLNHNVTWLKRDNTQNNASSIRPGIKVVLNRKIEILQNDLRREKKNHAPQMADNDELVRSLKDRYEKLRKTIDQTNESHTTQLKSYEENYSRENKNLTDLLRNAQSKIEGLEHSTETTNLQNSNLIEYCKTLSANNTEKLGLQKDQLVKNRTAAEKALLNVSSKEAQISGLTLEKNRLVQRLQDETKNRQNFETSLDVERVKCSDLSFQNTMVKADMARLEKISQINVTELARVNGEIDTLGKEGPNLQTATITDLEQSLKNKDKEINDNKTTHEEQLTELREALKTELDNHHNKFQKKLKQSENIGREHDEQVTKLRETLETEASQVLEASLASATLSITSLETKNVGLIENVATLKEDLRNKTNNIAEAGRSIKAQQTLTTLMEHTSKIAYEDCARLRGLLSEMRFELATTESSFKEADVERQNLTGELQLSVEALESTKKELDEACGNRDEFEVELSSTRSILESARVEIERLTNLREIDHSGDSTSQTRCNLVAENSLKHAQSTIRILQKEKSKLTINEATLKENAEREQRTTKLKEISHQRKCDQLTTSREKMGKKCDELKEELSEKSEELRAKTVSLEGANFVHNNLQKGLDRKVAELKEANYNLNLKISGDELKALEKDQDTESKFQDDFHELRKSLSASGEKLRAANKEIQTLRAEGVDNQNEQNTAKETLRELREQNSILQSLQFEKQTEIKNLTNTVNETKRSVAQKDIDLSTLTSDYNLKKTQLSEANRSLSHASEKEITQNSHLTLLQDELKQYKTSVAKNEEKVREMEGELDRLGEVEVEYIELLTGKLENEAEGLQEAKDETTGLEEVVERLTTKLEESIMNSDTFRGNLEAASAEIETLRSSAAASTEELEKTTAQTKKLETELTAAKVIIERQQKEENAHAGFIDLPPHHTVSVISGDVSTRLAGKDSVIQKGKGRPRSGDDDHLKSTKVIKTNAGDSLLANATRDNPAGAYQVVDSETVVPPEIPSGNSGVDKSTEGKNKDNPESKEPDEIDKTGTNTSSNDNSGTDVSMHNPVESIMAKKKRPPGEAGLTDNTEHTKLAKPNSSSKKSGTVARLASGNSGAAGTGGVQTVR